MNFKEIRSWNNPKKLSKIRKQSKMIKLLFLVKKIHSINSIKKILKMIFHTLTSTTSIINWLIILWFKLKKKLGSNLKILSIMHVKNIKIVVRKWHRNIIRKIINSSKMYKSNRFLKLRSLSLIICILLVKEASAKYGRPNIKKLRINMPWNKCSNLCNLMVI